MSRYTGPRLKIVRRFGDYLPGLSRKKVKNRTNPPGQHGGGRFRKQSDYGDRLVEKQKVRFNYGIAEKQLLRYFKKAVKMKGDTGHNLLTMLESRLDNVVFRAGLAPTIPAARQLVNHGHVTVEGRKVDIPSFLVKKDQVVSLREKSKKLPIVQDGLNEFGMTLPEFLSLDRDKLEVTVVGSPGRHDVLLDVNETLIIEHYSRTV